MNTRDIGLNYGAGKGDAPRHTANETWKENFEAINWFTGTRGGFRKVGHRLVKRYGVDKKGLLDTPPQVCE